MARTRAASRGGRRRSRRPRSSTSCGASRDATLRAGPSRRSRWPPRRLPLPARWAASCGAGRSASSAARTRGCRRSRGASPRRRAGRAHGRAVLPRGARRRVPAGRPHGGGPSRSYDEARGAMLRTERTFFYGPELYRLEGELRAQAGADGVCRLPGSGRRGRARARCALRSCCAPASRAPGRCWPRAAPRTRSARLQRPARRSTRARTRLTSARRTHCSPA